MGQLFLIAVRNLITHSRRTLLLGGAIVGVTALLVLLLGVLNGIRSTILESATTLMTGHVNVGGFFKVTAGAGGSGGDPLPGDPGGHSQGGARARLRDPARTGLGEGGERHRLPAVRSRGNRHPPRARVPAGDPGEGGVARRARRARNHPHLRRAGAEAGRPGRGSADPQRLHPARRGQHRRRPDRRHRPQRGAPQQLEHLRPRRDAARPLPDERPGHRGAVPVPQGPEGRPASPGAPPEGPRRQRATS